MNALTYVAAPSALIALVLLVFKPRWGVLALFIVRPLVDTTWDQVIVAGFKLTELVSAATPLIVLLRMGFDDDASRTFRNMPLKGLWILWSLDVFLFSSAIMFTEGLNDGANVLLRHLNGLAGFYMLQAYCKDTDDLRRWAWALAFAGLFPIATGLFEALSGVHWRTTFGEDGVIRNIGLYHDAITIRYYALQTIMGLLLVSALAKHKSMTLFAALAVYGVAAIIVVKGAYSKSGFITLAAWLLLWPLLLKQLKTFGALAAAAIVAGAYYSLEIMDSVGFIFGKEIGALQGSVGVERTFSGRWQIWTDMLAEWRHFDDAQRLFGSGHVALGAHNDYLQILIHGGVLGLSIYICLLTCIGVAIAKLLIARRDVLSVAALLAFIMWNVDALGLVPSAYSGYQWFVWGLIGVCLRLRMSASPVPVAQVHEPTKRFPNLMGAA
jgi:hypothetical protein